MPDKPVLEPAAQAFADATAQPPYLYQIAVADGRKAVDDVQSGEDVPLLPVDEEWVTVHGGPTGDVRTRIVRPRGSTGPGEAYAGRLRAAGVPVTALRVQGAIHDFVMLNALRETRAAELAIGLAARTLREALA